MRFEKITINNHAVMFILNVFVKFLFSEKATKFCVISTVDLSYVVMVKSTVEISKQFVTFSEYMNFIISMYSCRYFRYQLGDGKAISERRLSPERSLIQYSIH